MPDACATMLETIDTCPVPVVTRVHGAALGGGMGLCAVSDIVVSTADAAFGFTETRLGILPAVIGPFALAKIGESHARALFLAGSRFGAERARGSDSSTRSWRTRPRPARGSPSWSGSCSPRGRPPSARRRDSSAGCAGSPARRPGR